VRWGEGGIVQRASAGHRPLAYGELQVVDVVIFGSDSLCPEAPLSPPTTLSLPSRHVLPPRYANMGRKMLNYFAITHPSQPNYW
jgi:hypothetical protein